MKIEKPGFYRTRDGRKANVAAFDPDALPDHSWIGWVDKVAFCCGCDGHVIGTFDHGSDIVSEWVEPVPWDWSTTPPWLNYLAMDEDSEWTLYTEKPQRTDNGLWSTDGPYCAIPPAFYPKWSGDWRQSLTVRPGYKENSK